MSQPLISFILVVLSGVNAGLAVGQLTDGWITGFNVGVAVMVGLRAIVISR